MSKPVFETFWTVASQQYTNIDEVAELVEAGHIAVEVPAEKQARNWQRQQLLEKWHRVAIERHAKHIAEQQHRDTPEGKREQIIRHAAQHPGGIVTTGVDGCPELDFFSPSATDIFK